MLLPALNDLALKVVVTFVGRQPGLDFIRPYVDHAMDLEASGWHRLFVDEPEPEALPVSESEVVAAFFSDADGVIQRNLNASLPHAVVHLFGSLPPQGEDIHVAEYLACCLKSAGLPVDPAGSIETVQSGAGCKETKLSGSAGTILFHPGSGSLEKNHPPDFWVDLISRLLREKAFCGFKPVLLMGPAETSLYPYFKEMFRDDGNVRFVSCPDRDTLIQTLDTAVLFLGHDSGITHLSALKCVPTVALFKKNNVNQWKPLGPSVRVIEKKNPGPELLEEIVEACKGLIRLQRSLPNVREGKVQNLSGDQGST
jgi:hypothetical protein